MTAYHPGFADPLTAKHPELDQDNPRHNYRQDGAPMEPPEVSICDGSVAVEIGTQLAVQKVLLRNRFELRDAFAVP